MAVARIPFVALGVSMLVAACSAAPEEIGVESSALGSNQCVTAKEQSTANIACPAGQTITKVVFASYGTPAGACGGFSAGACNASTSTSVLTSKCVGKNSCQIGSNNGVFGDPCPGTEKTLSAQVECSGGGGTTTPTDPTPTQGSSQVCASVNQNANAVLTCPSGQTISSIGFASYGTPTGSCGSFAASSCNEPSSKSKVEAECLGKSTCTINANDGYFGDPCWGVSKALKIQATCSGSTSDTPTTPTTPPATSGGKVYLGAYPGNGGCVYPAIENCVSWYEQQVGKKTAIVHAFSSFENGWDDWFTRVIQSGHTLMLTINPASKAIPDILAGAYDADLKRWGKAAADHAPGPIFFRYMHEMNLPNNPAGWMADHYGAANYVAAFRRVHDMLNAGAGSNTKIIHVWVPNVFWGAPDASNSIWFKPYYPGDAYADWVGLDGYPMSPTDSFDAQFGSSLALLESMTSHPIMIAEYGVVEMNPVGSQGNWKANWFTDLFGTQVGKHPQLKALFYQDGTDGGTDHRIDTSAQAVAAFKAAIAPAKFASSYP